jgi:cytochrome c
VRWRLGYSSVAALALFLGPAVYIARVGFDFEPGQRPASAFCEEDIGALMERRGHAEEMLWRGCLIASETATYLKRFVTPKAGLNAASSDISIPACLDCHDSTTAPNFAVMWTRFPRYDPTTQRVEDFAEAIQREVEHRYGGTRPNRADNTVTALFFYAAEKAAQSRLRFDVDKSFSAAAPVAEVTNLAATDDCRRVFDQMGWPNGSNSPGVVQGCNLISDTGRYLRGPITSYWETGLSCQSCHLEAGTRHGAGNLAHAAVAFPAMHTASHQPIRFDRRVLLCFRKSMNTFDLGLDAQEIGLINLYANWLAQRQDLPIGEQPKGRGIPVLEESQGSGASFLAGEKVYTQLCQACHGRSGYGGAGPLFNGREPPPIAGPRSFNAAASLADAHHLAGFVYANMPHGATLDHPILTPQQALDVAAYLSALGRPSDFSRTNQFAVFFNHLWLKGITLANSWLASAGATE